MQIDSKWPSRLKVEEMEGRKEGYNKSMIEVHIQFDEEREKEFKTILDEQFGKRLKGIRKKNLIVNDEERLEKDFYKRAFELKKFRKQSQSAVISPLLSQALVKKTRKYLNNTKLIEEELTPLQKFHSVAKLVLVLVSLSSRWKRHDVNLASKTASFDASSSVMKEYYEARNNRRCEGEGENEDESRRADVTKHVKHKAKISDEMQNVLRKSPDQRTNEDLTKVHRLCRKIGAFSNFPVERELDVARNIGYECYGRGRVLCLQGRLPIRFYYILGGKVNKVKTVELANGVRKKYFGELRQGNTTDPEELQRIKPRKCSLIAKCFVEVLIIEKEDFMVFLQNELELEDSSAIFLRSLAIFQTFPLHSVQKETIQAKYFPKDTVVVKDVKESPLFYVIKSGTCKLLQKYKVDENGVPVVNRGFLPRIGRSSLRTDSTSTTDSTDDPQTLREAKQLHNDVSTFLCGSKQWEHEFANRKSINIGSHQQMVNLTVAQSKIGNSKAKMKRKGIPTLNELVFGRQEADSRPNFNSYDLPTKSEMSFTLPLITLNNSAVESSLPPREKEHRKSNRRSSSSGKKQKDREAYFQVGTLKAGDLYGIESITKKAARMIQCDMCVSAPSIVTPKSPEIIVMSEGTECILIDKKSFLETADFSTISRIVAMEHVSSPQNDVKMQIEKTRNWKRYKKKLVDDIMQRSKAKVKTRKNWANS